MITVKFRLRIAPKNKNEVQNAVRNISHEVQKEEGCIYNNVFQNLDNEDELIMIESWKSRDYLNKHWKSTNISALLGIQNLLIQPMSVEINNVSGTKDMSDIEKARASKKLNLKKRAREYKININDLTP